MLSSCHFRGLFPRPQPIISSHLRQSRNIFHKRCFSRNAVYLDSTSETPSRRSEKLRGLDEGEFRKKFVIRDGKTIKLLTPVVLSTRIKKLYEQGQLQEAIDMVKHSPPDAQNAVVWATLIGFVMSEKRYKEGYKLFNDVSFVSPTFHLFVAYCVVR